MLAPLAALLLASHTPYPAKAQDQSFDAYLAGVLEKARSEGVSDQTIREMTAGLTPNTRVIELDRAQPGTQRTPGVFPSVARYLDRHVEPARIANGRRVYRTMSGTVSALEERFGVPGPVLVAIWGHESAYGAVRGDFDLARALATLAWEGRRRDLFEREFISLLKVAERGYSRETLKGSWAGAFGNPQFLPSVYLRLATDGDGDGRADIIDNPADTLASIARYFEDAGWKRGVPWGVRAGVPDGFSWAAVENRVTAPVCPRVHERHSRWMSVTEWRELGVVPQGPIARDTQAMLFQPDGPGTTAWLLTGNYRAILEYNCSNYYALSVGELADQIAN
jgi:lytic murein transglycosylase